MLDNWKRPSELYAGNGAITPEEGAVLDLAQDVITDCSVVASLCSAIAREERSLGKVSSFIPSELEALNFLRFQSNGFNWCQIVSNIIYPQDAHGNPKTSPFGKYIVKLYFNGCFRKVNPSILPP